MTWLLRNNEKKIFFFGTQNSILNENFVWDYNLRLISNFQNPNIHTQNENLKDRPTLFHSSGFHCRPRQNLFWLLLYFFASKFHQPCQSTRPVVTFQAVCAFCSNLTSFTSFPKSEAINIHFIPIFEFTSLFNLFGFSFSFLLQK